MYFLNLRHRFIKIHAGKYNGSYIFISIITFFRCKVTSVVT